MCCPCVLASALVRACAAVQADELQSNLNPLCTDAHYECGGCSRHHSLVLFSLPAILSRCSCAGG